jgi:phosphoribosylamine---glycine ligase
MIKRIRSLLKLYFLPSVRLDRGSVGAEWRGLHSLRSIDPNGFGEKSIIVLLLSFIALHVHAARVLVVGNGGREHALAWKVAQSPHVARVFVAPGNGGTALCDEKIENVAIAATDIHALLQFAQEQKIDLTIVGPESALEVGIVDLFEQHGLHCFGPSRAAAQLETSKLFAKEFMMRHQIPTADYASFSHLADAIAYIEQHAVPLVIKADGLAAGKGVVVAFTKQEALDAATHMLRDHTFGAAGDRIIIEEYLDGQEITFIAVSDGKHVIPFATAQDHKKRDDGDCGPNTGGMGAYSPVCITDKLHTTIMQTIIEPTIAGMAHEGIPYRGFLYAGLMIMPDGQPKVLEFNCRLGDPEAQPILMRLCSDLFDFCTAVLRGDLPSYNLLWDDRVALGVVLASGGYPHAYKTGYPIQGLSALTDSTTQVFHAGTKLENNYLITTGGRVLCVTALADDIRMAQEKAYAAAAKISWPDLFYRTDIGWRACQVN